MSQCKILMQNFEELCLEIDVPLNTKKKVAPTTKLASLGLEIDTVKMQVSIPQKKKISTFYSLKHLNR